MDDRTAQPTLNSGSTTDFAQNLREQRGRVRQFVAAHRARLDRVESQLAIQLEQIQRDLDHERRQSGEVLAEGQTELAERRAQLDEMQRDLERREREWKAACEQTLADQQTQAATLTEQQQELAQIRAAHEATTQEHEATALEIERRLAAATAQQSELATAAAALAAREQAVVEREATNTAQEQALTSRQADLESRQAALDQQAAELKALQASLADERSQLAHSNSLEQTAALHCQALEKQLVELQGQLETAQTQLRDTTLARQQAESERDATLADQFATVESLRADLDEQLAGRAAALELVEADRDEAATELRSAQGQMAELRNELATQAAELVAFQAQMEQLSGELKRARDERQEVENSLHEREASLEEHRAALTAALERLREAQVAEHSAAAEHATAGAAEAEIARLGQERQLLLARLAEAESRAAADTTDADSRATDFEKRYQMALDDLREQKARNAELERKLSRAPAPAATTSDTSMSMDWESQKRRLLASLESSGEDEAEVDPQERFQLEEAIRTTDQAVSEKDREIRELRQLLADQSNLPSGAGTDSRLAAVLDQDLVIQQERLRLEQLETEWEEKLRAAEVEVSVERARLARERVQLDERIRQLQQEQAEHPVGSSSDAPAAKPTRGRWLARLGLKDQPE